MKLRRSLFITTGLIFLMHFSLNATEGRPDFWAHGFIRLDNLSSSADTEIDVSVGILHKFLFIRGMLRLEYENRFLFSDSLLLLDYVYSYKRHAFFVGVIGGVRHFSMGYSWNRFVYGWNAGYLFRLTALVSLGAEFHWYAIEGSSLKESRIILLPGFRF